MKTYKASIGLLGLATLGLGAYHGYCHAKGIPLAPNLDFALKYGPTIARGAIWGVSFGTVGLIGGGVAGVGASLESRLSTALAAGAVGGSVLLGGIGATIGGGYGAVQTLVGYGIGAIIGRIF